MIRDDLAMILAFPGGDALRRRPVEDCVLS
jgi:hypothetical protein